MVRTPFPATPGDVAALAVHEFAVDVADITAEQRPSIDRVCRTFDRDANRALVWCIRFNALKAWCDRPDVSAGLTSGALALADACALAASFTLNDRWEFEAEAFRSAITAATSQRART